MYSNNYKSVHLPLTILLLINIIANINFKYLIYFASPSLFCFANYDLSFTDFLRYIYYAVLNQKSF